MKWIMAGVLFSALMLAWSAFWPLVQANNEYEVAETTFDAKAKCRAAGGVADAWARLGADERAREWNERQFHNCRFAYPERH